MKKMICAFLALALLTVCLAGCGSGRAERETEAPDTASSAPELCTYTVYCFGAEDHAEIEGVIVNFCTDTACTPVTTSEQGTAVFTGPPERYHVQIVSVPAGWKLAQEETEWYTEPFGETYRIPFEEVRE